MREARAVCRGWRGRCFGLAVAAALVAVGCSGSSGNGGQTSRSAGQAATATTLVQPGSRCGAPEVKATLLRFPAADGTQLDGVLVGGGPAGVVLLHQYPADLCGFWPYAVYLSKRGLQALAIDLRCFGVSACPQAEAKNRVVDDVAGAVAVLRARGARQVALVGASMGATTALLAGAALRPPVAAVVSLSTGKFDLSMLLGLLQRPARLGSPRRCQRSGLHSLCRQGRQLHQRPHRRALIFTLRFALAWRAGCRPRASAGR